MEWVAVLIALSLVAQWWSRRSARRGARKLQEVSKALYSGAHEYRECQISAFPHVDRRFYDEIEQMLVASGFVALGDVEDVTSAAVGPTKPTPIRTLVGDDGRIVAGAYHAVVGGPIGWLLLPFGMRSLKIIDFESRFSDGTVIATSNAQVASSIDYPPQIQAEFHPRKTSVSQVLDRHRVRVREHLKRTHEARVSELKTLPAVIAHAQELDRVKSEFRQTRGGRLTAAEIQRVAGGKSRAAELLAEEQAKLE